MQFIDLQRQYIKLKQEIDKGIQNVLDHSCYIMGSQVHELEIQLAEYVGRKFCITCANGTDALMLALMAYGVKSGDAVFVPTFTFYASAEVISFLGATPVFVDIDPWTFNLSAESLKEAIKRVEKEGKISPRAIIAVDLFGLPADFIKIHDIAEEYNLLVIEDAAQGFGGSQNGRMACSLGDISTTSFFPAKPLGCYGDGGAIFTNEHRVKETLESYRVHGKGTDKYDNVRVGMNSRLDTLQAAILLPKLKAFKEYELKRRQEIAELYKNQLKGVVYTPLIPDKYTSSYAQYSILLENEIQRDKMQSCLKEAGIPSMIYYPKSMHQQTVFRNNPSSYWKFPNADDVSKRILSLPMYPYLEEEEVFKIVGTLIEHI